MTFFIFAVGENMKQILAAAAVILLTACAATGTQVHESQLQGFKKGKTTLQEVTDTLGAPNTRTAMSDGSKMICYSYAKVTARPEGFIPYVGVFAGGSDIVSNTACLQFNKNDVLQSYTASSSQRGSGYGVEAGTPAPRISAEPKQSNQ